MIKRSLLPLILLIALCASETDAAPFSRWAVRGVIVNKTFRTTPLSHSLGVDGIYKLEVRDEKNQVRHQMVPRDLFLAYEIGDNFAPDSVPPTVEERAQRLAAAEVKEKAAAVGTEEPEMLPVPETKNRLVQLNFPQDMLPETEGF